MSQLQFECDRVPGNEYRKLPRKTDKSRFVNECAALILFPIHTHTDTDTQRKPAVQLLGLGFKLLF